MQALQIQKPQTALPPSIEQEIALAQAGEWNLTQFRKRVEDSDGLRQRLSEELERLSQSLQPAGENDIKACLGKLILHYPMTNMTAHEKTLLLEDYIEELRPFPPRMIATACREYCLNPENQFFPKLAVLVGSCSAKFHPLKKKLQVLQNVVSQHKAPEENRKVTPQDWQDLINHLGGKMSI